MYEFFQAFDSIHITYGPQRRFPLIPRASVIEIRGKVSDTNLFALSYWAPEDSLLSLLYYSYCENCLKITPRKAVHLHFKEYLERWPDVSCPPYRNLNEMAIAHFTDDRLEILNGIEPNFR
jgi:hypothetical protein